MRHILPGEGRKYAQYPLDELCKDLERFSPFRLIQRGVIHQEPPVQTTQGGQNLKLNGDGVTIGRTFELEFSLTF
jgi:hypothetical protein